MTGIFFIVPQIQGIDFGQLFILYWDLIFSIKTYEVEFKMTKIQV